MAGGDQDARDDAWCIRRDDAVAPPTAHDATLFALANGAIGVRGGLDELGDDGASFLPDLFVRRPIPYHERFPGFADATDTRVAAPSATALVVELDGAPVDFATARIVEGERVLDLAAGVLRRRTRWRLANGRHLDIVAERLVPLDGSAVVATRLAVTPPDGARLALLLPLRLAAEEETDPDDPRIARAGSALAIVETQPDALTAAAPDVRVNLAQRLATAGPVTTRDGAQQIETAGTLRLDRFVGYATTGPEPAGRLADAALATGFDALATRQRAALDAFWAAADLAIEGDPELARATRFNLFHLHQSAGGMTSIAAKGLTGEGYEGHVFWDAEAFMLPVLALTRPEFARRLLAFRHATLDAARDHARALGHARGALFPWRTLTGTECSSHYPTGSAQYHINAAIAWGVELYLAATGDDAFMLEAGAELVVETARLWLDLGHFSARRGGAFVIHGVTGPDEYSALVDNDYYTNALAKRHLAHAARLARDLAQRQPEHHARLGLSAAEADEWAEAASRMHLPVDPALGVSPQDDAFLGKPALDLSARRPGDPPLLMQVHPMVLFRHRVCKQGDVVQAMMMAGDDAPLGLKARNLAYYAPLTTHDSTLSAPAFAILAAETGDDAAALGWQRDAAFVDLDDRHGNTGHGAHMAAMAGSWLALVQGWGGLRIEEDAAWFRPRCPATWRGWRARFVWRGSTVELAVDAAGASYRLIAGPPVRLFDHARPIDLDVAERFVARPAIRAAIFDLDGVLTDSAAVHYRAWKRLCDEEGIPFDAAVNEQLKGVDRAGSLRLILAAAGLPAERPDFDALLARKNGYYRAAIADTSPADLFPGVPALFARCRRAGLKLALASASRNAGDLVARLGIAGQFDHIADAAAIARPKPDPEIFLACATVLGVDPAACVGIEDASAGVAAIRAAGMRAIGIGDPAQLAAAGHIVPTIADLDIADLLTTTKRERIT